MKKKISLNRLAVCISAIIKQSQKGSDNSGVKESAAAEPTTRKSRKAKPGSP